MIRNYFLTAMRNWVTHKLFTAISIGGLTVGLTCTVFIMLFVRDEMSYDRWIPDSKNLYRIEFNTNFPGQPPNRQTVSPFPAPAAMAEQIPEVTAMTHLMRELSAVSIGDRVFPEYIDVVDPGFFQVIKLPLVSGDPATVLSDPESAVISQSVARKYFGTEIGIVGKTLSIMDAACSASAGACRTETHTVAITGVLRDLPHNTQLAADIVIPNTSSADSYPRRKKTSWLWADGRGYVLLAPGAKPANVLAKFKVILDRSFKAELGSALPNAHASDFYTLNLTRFWDAHLTTDRYGGLAPAGNRATVYGFAVIGLLIILIACFNFTNLAIARATLRSREIALRKVVGARRSQIIVQFLGEAVLMVLAALLLTLAAIQPLLPSFDRLLNKPITFQYLHEGPLLVGILAVAIVAGLLSGLYPAVVLSSFKPAATLRTSAAQGAGSGRFRAVLVILQFAVSIGLGIGAMVMSTQISYVRHIDLGFQQEGIVVINQANVMPPANRESFVDALRQYPGVKDAALGTDVPFQGNENNAAVQFRGALPTETMRTIVVAPEFTSTYGVRLLAGRFLSEQHAEDRFSRSSSSLNVLVNAAAALRMGFTPEQALGKPLVLLDNRLGGTIGPTGPTGAVTATIVGVIDNIEMEGPRHQITKTIYFDAPDVMSSISVKVRPENLSQTLSFIDKTWSEFAPGLPIQRYFLSDVFNNQFASDVQQGTVLVVFVGIAIFIACLGLFGLAAFTAERRTKEIGLRKTFGGKTRHIVLLLLWQFSIPVLIANVIAWPVAYYYLHGWLDGYADRISLNPLYFVGAGAAALMIAWTTVYAHAYRIARANPINALRYE